MFHSLYSAGTSSMLKQIWGLDCLNVQLNRFLLLRPVNCIFPRLAAGFTKLNQIADFKVSHLLLHVYVWLRMNISVFQFL